MRYYNIEVLFNFRQSLFKIFRKKTGMYNLLVKYYERGLGTHVLFGSNNFFLKCITF